MLSNTKVLRVKNGNKGPSSSAKKDIKTPLDEFLLQLRPGQSIDLLKALHILTPDGRLNQDSRRKLKQVYHLYQFIERELLALPAGNLTVVDLGAGKSYLGFLIYDLFFKAQHNGQVIAIESRPELVQASVALAMQLRFQRMQFLPCTVTQAEADARVPATVDVVTALHACDTATDDAIAFGLAKQAKAMVLVPCCQATAARFMNQSKALTLSRTPLAELWRHPVHTREMGSQITNVLRCLYLEAKGYQVTVTELVGWEHSMKNELILARWTGQPKHAAQTRLASLVEQFGLEEMASKYYS
jgi:Methyltransferase domain